MSETTPEAILAAADTEVRDADAELAALESAVIADEDVRPEQIEQARSRKYFAGLRRQAAERKAAALRQEQIDAKAARARDAFLDAIAPYDLDKLPELQRQAEEALAEIMRITDGYANTVYQHVPLLAPYTDASTLPVSAYRPGYTGQGNTITIDGKLYHRGVDGRSLTDQALRNARQRAHEAQQRATGRG